MRRQVLTGLDVLSQERFERLKGRSVAVLCNQASVNRDLAHIVDLLVAAGVDIKTVFGPQHGPFGHTQDNMVEWTGRKDERTGIMVHSLYGEHRTPTDESLEGIDLFLVDLQDVGARYYTFIWTMANCMEACERLGITMTVLDRPNPIGGSQVGGPVMRPEFSSFVGKHPLPARHGMTIAEIAIYLRNTYYEDLDLQVVPMHGWARDSYFDELDLPWIPPSPNVPIVETAVVYPGMCLLEGTNLSEGRGTTRPFESFGAPWLDGWKLAASLNDQELTGVYFRPTEFQPTFQKHEGVICGGCFIHVTDRCTFEPVLTALAIIRACHQQSPVDFAWKEPPYEYEHKLRPIDLLLGSADFANEVIGDVPLAELRSTIANECDEFTDLRLSALLSEYGSA